MPNNAIGNQTLGQNTMANSMPVAIASDQSVLLATPAATTPNTVASGTGDTAIVAATASLRLIGFACKEDAGSPAAAEFILRHGDDAADPILIPVKLAAGESRADWFGPDGIACASGIFLDRVTGTTQVTIFTKVQD